MASGSAATADDVLHEQHVGFFLRFLGVVPKQYASLDTSRLMMVYFSLSALDVLGALGRVGPEERARIVDWVYSNQVVLVAERNGVRCGGFLGSGFTGPQTDAPSKYHQAHVSMTYCALLVLAMLGDDYSRVDKDAVVEGLRALQQPDGSFQSVAFGTENDTRFVFCACAISFMMQDFRGVDVDKTAAFLLASQSYDGGFGILPNQETHSGAIYTAVASLALLGRVDDVDRESLERFLLMRQVGGFNGRINKKPDTCYTFWVGGSLQMLALEHLMDRDAARPFLMSCQSAIGGFSKYPGKYPDAVPDILHSYYSVCGLSLLGEPGFAPIQSCVGLTKSTFDAAPFCKTGPPLTGAGTPYAHRASTTSPSNAPLA